MGSFISWLNSAQKGDDRTGSAKSDDSNTHPPSAFSMVLTLGPIALISLVYIIIFLLMRRSNRRFYAPRTYLGSLRESKRSPELPNGFLNWFGAFWKLPDDYALKHQGLDAYLFMRYLKICATICFVSLCITWPILFPVNATGGGGQQQLEVLSYSNINIDTQKNRFYAHTFVAWIVYSFVMYTVMRECIFYINLRQAYLLTPHYAKRISARTVLFTSVPPAYREEAKIRQIFTNSVKHVWIAGDSKDVDEMVEERDKTAMKLEKAEIKLLKTVNEERNKFIKKNGGEAPSNGNGDTEHGSIAARWITDKQRPHHRLGFLGLIGEKVDTIEWGRTELAKMVPETEKAQNEYLAGKFEKTGAVFVEFHTQSDAQAAFQVLSHHHALQMSPKYIGITPQEIVWKSFSMSWHSKIVRRYAVYGIITALIVFWAIPVGIVGIISQINTLKNIPGLTWLGSLPKPVLGLIGGLLPSVALSILMSLVPVFMRALAKMCGEPSLSRVELFTQNAYFFFQLIQVFLISTLSSSASTVLIQIAKSPNQVFDILSKAIPTSANFFISYFIVQGLTIATGVMTQVVGLVVFRLLYKFLAKTPRAMYTKWTALSAISWGSVMPVYTTIALISVTYSVIAPLILFWSSIGLFLFYLAYRYNVLFVTDTVINTNGLIYPRALKQLTAGVYIAEICMIGLFICSKAAGPAVLMVLFTIVTILFQMTMSRALDPLLYNLPRTLTIEEEAIQSQTNGTQTNGDQLESGEPSNQEAAEQTETNGSGVKKVLNISAGGSIQKKGNLFSKFLKPWEFADYHTLRAFVPEIQDVSLPELSEEVDDDKAYYPPSVISQAPILWIPTDPLGVSKQEIALTSKVIPISDEGATLDEKNKILWDSEGARPPIWSEKIDY